MSVKVASLCLFCRRGNWGLERLPPSHGWKVVSCFRLWVQSSFSRITLPFTARMHQAVICRKEVPECGTKMGQKQPCERPGNKPATQWWVAPHPAPLPPSLFPGTPSTHYSIHRRQAVLSLDSVVCRRLELVWPQRGYMGVEKKNGGCGKVSNRSLLDATVSPTAGRIYAPPWLQKSFPLRTLIVPTASRLKNFMEMWKFFNN